MEHISQVPSAVDLVAGVIAGTAKTTSRSAVKSVSYRAPIQILARIDALASKAGKSRNKTISMLLDVGIEELFVRLKEKDVEDVLGREMQILTDLVHADDLEQDSE